MTDAKGLVINANKFPRCALLRRETHDFHELGDVAIVTHLIVDGNIASPALPSGSGSLDLSASTAF
jgi:hypothetical protein